MLFIALVVITIITVDIIVIRQNNKEIDKLIGEIQDQYRLLNDIVISSYDLKVCPKCFEKEMTVFNVSPTGQS